MVSNNPFDPKYQECPETKRYYEKTERLYRGSGRILSVIRFAPFVAIDLAAIFKICDLDAIPELILPAIVFGAVLCILAGKNYKKWVGHYADTKIVKARITAWNKDHPDMSYEEAVWVMYERPRREEMAKNSEDSFGPKVEYEFNEEGYQEYLRRWKREQANSFVVATAYSKPIWMLLVVNAAFLAIPILLFTF